MRTLAIFSGLAAGLVLATFLPRSPWRSEAGTAVKMDLEEVVEASDLVLEGRVVAGRSHEDEEGQIFTDWEITVDRTFVGIDQPTRTVRMPGGVLSDGRGLVIPGMPRLLPGEDVVLMLSGETGSSALRMPTGLAQGKYRIVTDALGSRKAVRTGEHLTLATATSGSTRSVDGLSVLDYAELVARLEAASQVRKATRDEADVVTEDDDR